MRENGVSFIRRDGKKRSPYFYAQHQKEVHNIDTDPDEIANDPTYSDETACICDFSGLDFDAACEFKKAIGE